MLDADGGMSLQDCSNGYMSMEIESIFNTHCLVRFGDYDPETDEGINGAIDGVSYADNGGSVTTYFAADNLRYEVIVSTGLCPISEGSGNSGEYAGTTLVEPAEGSFGWDE